MATHEQRVRLAGLIEEVVAGRLSPEGALKLTNDWPDVPWNEKTIDLAWHALTHFQIDQDICAKDPSYAEHMKSSLLKVAASLRANETTTSTPSTQ